MSDKKYDFLFKEAQILLPNGLESCDLATKGGKIAALGNIAEEQAEKIINLKGKIILPGIIDSQVHFREPGPTHKEDIASGTLGALHGGITTVFEMPNTSPPTIDAVAMADKVTKAKGRAWTNIGFYMGGADQNVDKLKDLENVPGCVGIKVFFGSSTGSLLFNNMQLLEKAMKSTKKLMSFHCEDEDRLQERKHLTETAGGDASVHAKWRDELTALNATQKVVNLAKKVGRKVHILHITTAEEMEFLSLNKDTATVEVLPQHLTLSAPECYEKLGTYAQMNPPIREKRHQDALWKAIDAGIVDVIGSDHAPHTREEKDKGYPNTPAGLVGVQTLLPIMLNHVNNKKLSLEKLVELTCTNPARLAGLESKGCIEIGKDADLTVVDMNKKMTITNAWIKSKSAWTPYDGMEVTGWPVMTIIGGQIAMRDDVVLTKPQGKVLFS